MQTRKDLIPKEKICKQKSKTDFKTEICKQNNPEWIAKEKNQNKRAKWPTSIALCSYLKASKNSHQFTPSRQPSRAMELSRSTDTTTPTSLRRSRNLNNLNMSANTIVNGYYSMPTIKSDEDIFAINLSNYEKPPEDIVRYWREGTNFHPRLEAFTTELKNGTTEYPSLTDYMVKMVYYFGPAGCRRFFKSENEMPHVYKMAMFTRPGPNDCLFEPLMFSERGTVFPPGMGEDGMETTEDNASNDEVMKLQTQINFTLDMNGMAMDPMTHGVLIKANKVLQEQRLYYDRQIQVNKQALEVSRHHIEQSKYLNDVMLSDLTTVWPLIRVAKMIKATMMYSQDLTQDKAQLDSAGMDLVKEFAQLLTDLTTNGVYVRPHSVTAKNFMDIPRLKSNSNILREHAYATLYPELQGMSGVATRMTVPKPQTQVKPLSPDRQAVDYKVIDINDFNQLKVIQAWMTKLHIDRISRPLDNETRSSLAAMITDTSNQVQPAKPITQVKSRDRRDKHDRDPKMEKQATETPIKGKPDKPSRSKSPKPPKTSNHDEMKKDKRDKKDKDTTDEESDKAPKRILQSPEKTEGKHKKKKEHKNSN